MTNEVEGSWETQRPIEQAQSKHQLQTIQKKYSALIEHHAELIRMMYLNKPDGVHLAYLDSLFEKTFLFRDDLDDALILPVPTSITKKLK